MKMTKMISFLNGGYEHHTANVTFKETQNQTMRTVSDEPIVKITQTVGNNGGVIMRP